MKKAAPAKAKAKAKAKGRQSRPRRADTLPLTALARLEAQNPQRAAFLRQYLVDWNGQAAAERAGYAANSAKVQASRILADPLCQEALAQLQQARMRRIDMTGDRVVQLLALIAEADPRRLFDPVTGDRLPVHQLPDDVALALAGVRSTVTEAKERTTTKWDYRLVDRKGCLELLGRHFRQFSGDPPLPDGSLPTPGQPQPQQVEARVVIERRVIHVNKPADE